jgi:UDP-GlcNAc:undecaprenyl-phosphate GlcNAc-1-phosphate transferase
VLDSPLITTPLLTFVITALLHVFALRIFPRLKLLDFPERYGFSRARLPYPTGIIAVIVFIAVFPLLQTLDRSVLGVMSAVILLGISCFIDDRKNLPALARLFIQLCAALLVFFTGDCTGGRICSVTNPLEGFFGGPIIELNGAIPFLSLVVTVIWLMLTTNALNWFDGIPGQVGTLSGIGFLTIGLLCLSARVNQPQIALIAFALAGIAFAGLLFDFPPAQVVMGDSGSMFFGLMLGILTIYAGGKVATAFLVLGVPILDLVFVVIKRLSEKRSPFKGSMSGEHLHHRLLAKGWSARSIIVLTAAIGALFGGSALYLTTFGKFIAALILAVVMLMLWIYSAPRR